MKKKSNVYFTKETEDAIVKYNNTEDYELKNLIYERYIHYPFYKLCENITDSFKFHNTEVDNLDHLYQEIIIYLLSKIHLYKPENGKAYSYFGTSVKRWLIGYNRTIYAKKISHDDITEMSDDDSPYQYDPHDCDSNECNDKLSNFIDQYIIYCEKNLNKWFPKPNEHIISSAVMELFKRHNSEMFERIEKLNKKIIYIYLRELIPPFIEEREFDLQRDDDLIKYDKLVEKDAIIESTNIIDERFLIKYRYEVTAPQITKVTNKLYRIFRNNYIFYCENDYIFFKS